MGKPVVWITLILVLALVVVGLIIKGPQPEVVLKAEEIFSIGGFHVTNTIITAYLVTAILAIVTYLATRKASLIPSGFYNFVEAAVEWMLSVVEEIAGPKNGRRFFMVVATIFLFVISCNYFGLLPIVNSIGVVHRTQGQETGYVADKHGIWTIGPNATRYAEGKTATDANVQLNEAHTTGVFTFRPYLRSVNTDANSPLAIALWSFIFVEMWGLQSLGSKYLGKFLAFPPFAKGSGPIGVFVGFLELLSEFIRIISFTFRLFGNIFAGDVLILFMSFLVPFVLPMIFYGLETFVGFIQAAVFALLTLVFAVMAVEHHDEGGHEAAETHGAHVEAAAH